MSTGFHSEQTSLWLTKREQLPDVCCTCGMFSDNRVKVKHTGFVTKQVSGGPSLLMILFHIFSGPLGWLLALVSSRETEETKTVKQKTKIQITQCQLCNGLGPPEVVNFLPNWERFEFLVHPEFARRFQEINAENKQDQF